ncbi:GIY-YIG nuclease family protein [Massilia sp. YIM B02443]|uniref:GIY-YIG nuclease family protein n=1 Tax=Massilia sp. YIM B02443 TaxID=3050127 RepID=UPI0025B67263|nr:GIY-YIG nuclease family protein [Massilia sp. YIM B02443]MDN4040233.1 GIY-YIG nuclease family protein [Massilia sp. YIM B02443]
MDRLLQIGFREIGHWISEAGRLRLQLQALPPHRRALYAFVVDNTILYVGKTSGSLNSRLNAYVAPHATQRTNVRNRTGLLELLDGGRAVRILGWIDPGLHRIGPFDLNMAAGLEDSIIALLAPPWNGAGSAEAVRRHVAVADALPAAGKDAAAMPEGVPVPAPSAASAATVMAGVPPPAVATPRAALLAPSTEITFTVKLGKTYYERGFFNVPVAFSSAFGSHGARMDLYCGDERAHLHALLDRKANQLNQTPRIYGKAELATWFQRRFQLDGTLRVTVLGPTSAVLS